MRIQLHLSCFFYQALEAITAGGGSAALNAYLAKCPRAQSSFWVSFPCKFRFQFDDRFSHDASSRSKGAVLSSSTALAICCRKRPFKWETLIREFWKSFSMIAVSPVSLESEALDHFLFSFCGESTKIWYLRFKRRCRYE